MEAIFAVDDDLGFGHGGKLPWPFIKEDMQHFIEATKGKKLIMGRRTYDTLPIKPTESRPFHVLSRRNHINNTPYLKYSEEMPKDGILIGGATLFNEVGFIEKCSKVHVTRIKGNFNAGTKIKQSVLEYLDTHFTRNLITTTDKCTIWCYSK